MDAYYVLPIGAVVETMKSIPDRVMLQADLPSLPEVCTQACLAQITLGQGYIFSCLITVARTGAVLLQQQKAYATLERCGDMTWRVHPAPAVSVSVGSAGSSSRTNGGRSPLSSVPSLRIMLTPAVLSTVSPPYRRVLALVDGRRSLEEIASLLNKTPQEIQQMLVALEHLVEVSIDTDQYRHKGV